MESLQMTSIYFLKVTCYLILGNYLAHQMGNLGSVWGVGKDTVTGVSYFFYQQPAIPRDCQEVNHQCPRSQNASGVYRIKPDGFLEPFEVFCDNSVEIGGWTVIQRRIDGSVDFNRNWAEYQTGFGFMGSEFWLGNERLSHMLHQKKYEIRIDIMNNEGTSCNLTYDEFRICDEWGDYKIVSMGRYSGTADLCITSCPKNMEYGNCSCQATCEDPSNENGCNNVCIEEETCVCPNGFLMKGSDCVNEEDCGCFLEGMGVIKDDGIFINSDCSRRCSCKDNQLTCEDIRCSADATCRGEESEHQCECNQGFTGDGWNCTLAHTDCLDLYNSGVLTDGVYKINPAGLTETGFEVYCEMESNGGGWTVFQRRVNGTVDFYRKWDSYKEGFGALTHEFWLGNDKLHNLTRQGNYQLRIDVVTSQGEAVYSLFSSFTISDENDKYRLRVGTESGNTVGNPLRWNNEQPFSTYDQDNDDTDTYNCAEEHRGAWWYNHVYDYTYYCWKWRPVSSYEFCSDSNLNGGYHEARSKGVYFWYSYNREAGCGITRTEMKIRPV